MNRKYALITLLLASAAYGQDARELTATTTAPSDWNGAQYDPSLLEIRSELHGIARPKLDSIMRSARSGVIQEVHITDGDWVSKGDALVSLNDAIARAAWKAAKALASQDATVEAAQLNWQLAQKRIQRLEQAFRENASSAFELEERRSDVEQARAAYNIASEEANAAKANLEVATAELEQFKLRAPFDGQVVRLDKKVGTPVDPTENVLRIVDARQLEIEMYLPISLFGTMQSGRTYSMSAAAPVNRSIAAKVRYVAPVVDATSDTFRVIFTVDNEDLKLPAGFAVSLED